MKDRKAALFRLYPTPEQAAQMAQIAGACRFICNLALEQRQTWYRPGRKFSFASQCRKLTMLRAEVAWLNDSFRFPDPVSPRLERTGTSSGRLKLPTLGWVTLRGWQKLPGAISNITVSRRAGQ
jgi:putative transposase